MRFATLVVASSFMIMFLLSVEVVHASSPMPYTNSALKKLNIAAKKVGDYLPPPTKDEFKVYRAAIDHYANIFSAAGYSLDDTISKLVKDMSSSDFQHNNVTIVILNLILPLGDILEQAKAKDMPAEKLFKKSTYTSIERLLLLRKQDELAANQRKLKEQELEVERERREAVEEEKKALVAEKAAKTSALNKIVGNYSFASNEEDYSSFEVQVINEDIINVSFSRKQYDNSCLMKFNGVLNYKYDKDLKEISSIDSNFSRNNCDLHITVFGDFDGTDILHAEVKNEGLCRHYCKNDISFGGFYSQISINK